MDSQKLCDGILSLLTATIIQPNLVYTVPIDNDKVIPSCGGRIGTLLAHSMAQLDAKSDLL